MATCPSHPGTQMGQLTGSELKNDLGVWNREAGSIGMTTGKRKWEAGLVSEQGQETLGVRGSQQDKATVTAEKQSYYCSVRGPCSPTDCGATPSPAGAGLAD